MIENKSKQIQGTDHHTKSCVPSIEARMVD